MSKENKIVPDLRFPEFRDKDDWETKKLSEVLTEHGLKSTGKEEVHSVSVNKGIVNQIEHLGRSFSASSTDNYKLVKPGDIIYTKSPTGGFPFGIIKQSTLDKNVIVSPLYGVFSPDNFALGHILDSYFKSPLNTIKYLNSIIQKGAKNTINITNDIFLSKKLAFPSNKDEQKKIASCFDSIDQLIKVFENKLNHLRDHKKGLIQNLFPDNGKVIPKIRFKEFIENDSWEFFNGNLLFEQISNRQHNSDLPILAITQEFGAIPRDEINYNVIASKESIESYKVVEIDDFVISLRSFQGGIEYSNYRGICSPAYVILRKKNNTDCSSFFKHYFKSPQFIFELNRNIEGIRDGKMVSYKQFSEILIPQPSPQEQKKIADCLSDVDGLIKDHSMKLDQLKLHKKSLVQKLFSQPTLD